MDAQRDSHRLTVGEWREIAGRSRERRNGCGGLKQAKGPRVVGWKKGGRNGMVIRGAGGPRSNGYDSHGRVSVNRLVDERDCAVTLTKPDPDGAGPVLPGTGA